MAAVHAAIALQEQYIKNQNILDDFELLQKGNGTVTGTCDYDGVICINTLRDSSMGALYYATITDPSGNVMYLDGSGDGGLEASVSIPVKKGDSYTIQLVRTTGNKSLVKARWYKLRDYTTRT